MRARGVALGILVAVASLAPGARAQDDDEQMVPVPPGDEYADTDPSALTDFRGTLDPNGTWADDPTYGTVWTPDPTQVGPGFQPYDTSGSWDYVDNDYVWVSDFTWGWVCFHYGRWAWSLGRWVWIPGREYAGAWVSWRIADDELAMLGWAPLPPAWGWLAGAATSLGFVSQEPWTFASYGDVLSPGVAAHSVTGNRASPVVARSRPFVPAHPTVGAAAVPHGPPPSALGIDVSKLAPRQLPPRELHARQLARPSTAQPLGAHAPAAHRVRAVPRGNAGPRSFESPARGAPARGRR